jgi:aryl-alcohol dehydrogenase-like predicted oxidoreductase
VRRFAAAARGGPHRPLRPAPAGSPRPATSPPTTSAGSVAEGNPQHNLAIVDALRALAEQHGVTAGQLALAWVRHRGDDVVPIPGTKRRRCLAENVAAESIELSGADLAAIEGAVPADAVAGERYPAQMNNLLQR